MPIFRPDDFKKKVLPRGFLSENLLKNGMTLKKKAMQALIFANVGEDQLQKTVLKVANLYENKVDNLLANGIPKTKANILAKNGEKLLRQRIESLVIYSEVQKIKKDNKGKYYEWLPSGADEPSPQHQLLYGKTFLMGEGDNEGNIPGERYGCDCGMKILTNKESS